MTTRRGRQWQLLQAPLNILKGLYEKKAIALLQQELAGLPRLFRLQGLQEERYKEMMVETKRSKAVKSKKIEMDQADKASARSKLQDDIGELKSTPDEFIAADKYHEKLVAQFIDLGMTWEEVQKALQDVIGSLKEALEILGHQGSVDTSA